MNSSSKALVELFLMQFNWQPDEIDLSTVKAWLANWQTCVQGLDFNKAQSLFVKNTASFGTHMDVVEGIDALEENQWRNVWPNIEEFEWDFDNIKIGVSADRLMAFLITTWTSKGFDEEANPFDRPGRTTVILSRTSSDVPWLGVHTHFSLHPGTPYRTFGNIN